MYIFETKTLNNFCHNSDIIHRSICLNGFHSNRIEIISKGEKCFKNLNKDDEQNRRKNSANAISKFLNKSIQFPIIVIQVISFAFTLYLSLIAER